MNTARGEAREREPSRATPIVGDLFLASAITGIAFLIEIGVLLVLGVI